MPVGLELMFVWVLAVQISQAETIDQTTKFKSVGFSRKTFLLLEQNSSIEEW